MAWSCEGLAGQQPVSPSRTRFSWTIQQVSRFALEASSCFCPLPNMWHARVATAHDGSHASFAGLVRSDSASNRRLVARDGCKSNAVQRRLSAGVHDHVGGLYKCLRHFTLAGKLPAAPPVLETTFNRIKP